jgi:hypothetical protein
VHHQKRHLFCVDNVELDEVGSLVEGGGESLKGVFGEDGAETAVGDVEGATGLVDVGGNVGLRGCESEQEEG